ncbi:MAG: hypothetical protein LBS72_08825, partial [Oscillospiraceae bacterium]|nr:hypothetical protein [Oscillospiraceae bacterium]
AAAGLRAVDVAPLRLPHGSLRLIKIQHIQPRDIFRTRPKLRNIGTSYRTASIAYATTTYIK